MSRQPARRRAHTPHPPKLSILGAVLLLAAAPVVAQCESEEQQLIDKPNGKTLDAFGRRVAISGDRAAVSADAENSMGAVYAYELDGDSWTLAQKVLPADLEFLDRFGFSLVMEGSTMIVGNPRDDDQAADSGSVVVFEHDGAQWAEITELTPSVGVELGQFGWSLALDGDVLVVGAIGDESPGENNTGAAWVFRHDGTEWVEEQRLSVPGLDDFDELGFAVAVDGDDVFVAAVNDDGVGIDSGAVYTFSYDGVEWNEGQKLVSGDIAGGDWFGWALDVDGDLLAVSAPQHDAAAENSGALYFFERPGGVWVESDKIVPDGAGAFENFGWSVDLEGPRMVVGAAAADSFSGALYLFQDVGTQWLESHFWTGSAGPGTGFFNDSLGASVALDGAHVLGGAPFADADQEDAGVAYAYEVTDLAMAALPQTVQTGDDVTLRVCGGAPGEDVVIYLRGFGGDPASRRIDNGVFAFDGRFQTTMSFPGNAAGNEAEFGARGFWQPGVLGTSDVVTVTIEP